MPNIKQPEYGNKSLHFQSKKVFWANLNTSFRNIEGNIFKLIIFKSSLCYVIYTYLRSKLNFLFLFF